VTPSASAISSHERPSARQSATWRELPAAEMAAHLLATPTISDRAWTGESRVPSRPGPPSFVGSCSARRGRSRLRRRDGRDGDRLLGWVLSKTSLGRSCNPRATERIVTGVTRRHGSAYPPGQSPFRDEPAALDDTKEHKRIGPWSRTRTCAESAQRRTRSASLTAALSPQLGSSRTSSQSSKTPVVLGTPLNLPALPRWRPWGSPVTDQR
jgi:hypothetical protein